MHFDQLKRHEFITLLGGQRRRGPSGHARQMFHIAPSEIMAEYGLWFFLVDRGHKGAG